MKTDVNHYEPIEHVTAFSRDVYGPFPGKLYAFAVTDPSPEYPQARISISHDAIGTLALNTVQAINAAARLESMVADVDAALDAEQPPILVANSLEDGTRCQCCWKRILEGEHIQLFEETNRLVFVHAERCTEPPEPIPGIHYPLFFVDYRTVDGGAVREYARRWNDAVTRGAELAQRADVFDVEYTPWNGAHRG